MNEEQAHLSYPAPSYTRLRLQLQVTNLQSIRAVASSYSLNENSQGPHGTFMLGATHQTEPPSRFSSIGLLKTDGGNVEPVGVPEPHGHQGVTSDTNAPVAI